MGKKIYVGNLSYNSDEQGLETLFAEFGTVESAKIITDRNSGRSKGFGFVEMASDDEAQTAIEKLDGQEFDGRNLKVNEAKPKQPRDNNRGGFRGDRGRGPRR